jgi:hypothetical protein
MGLNDHMPDEDAFTAVAIQAGAVKTCPLHSGVVINQGDPEADRRAYAIATNKWKEGELAGDGEDITAGIKNAIDMAADECPVCAELRDA